MVIQELRRFFTRPLMYILLAGCMVVNLWILWNHGANRPLVLAGAACAKTASGALYVTEDTIPGILAALKPVENALPAQSLQGISMETLLEGTVVMARELTSSDLASAFIAFAGLTGGAAQKAVQICEGLSGIFDAIRESGIGSRFFVPCQMGFFEMFSQELFAALTVEGILICVLLMLRCANDAFSCKTAGLVLSTKRGRKSQWSRFFAGMAGSGGFMLMLWGLTLGAAALYYPLGDLWNTPLGSCMILSGMFPVIGRIPMTVLGYMAVELLMACLLGLLFAAAAFGLAQLWHNSFKVFLTMGFGCMVIYGITSLSENSGAYFILAHNPVDMAGKAGFWLASGAPWVAPPNYELRTLMVWGALTAVLIGYFTRRFYRQDIG